MTPRHTLTQVSPGSRVSADHHHARAALQADSTLSKVSRDDLSFTARKNDEFGHLMNWVPARTPPQPEQWNIAYRLGKAFVGEIQSLAIASEEDAFDAIRFALQACNWRVGGAGEESGFAAGVAALAIIGMRALRAGAEPYDPNAQQAGEEGV